MVRLCRRVAALGLVVLGLGGAAWAAGGRGGDLPFPNVEIETVTLDGHVANLTRNPALDTSPAVSPNGTQIAFVSSRGGKLDLYVMRSDGTNVQRVTTSPFLAGPASIGTSEVSWNDAGDTAIAWAPGGGSLAFDAQNAVFSPDCFHNCVDWRVLVVKPDGTGLKFVSDQAESPSWSPGGGRLAFVGSITPDLEGLEVTVVTLASGATVHVNASSYNIYNAPAWSRTGLLAIESLTGEQRPQRIETVRANGTQRKKLVIGSDPAWSPSGARLAFIRNRHLYTVAASGGPPQLLTAPLVHAGEPAWAPNGKWIAYLRSTGKAGQPQVAVVPTAGGAGRLLTHVKKGYAFQTRPVWTPDSKKVVFTLWRPKNA